MRDDFREAFRALLLPIAPDREEGCVSACEEALIQRGILADDLPVWLRLRADEWLESGNPPGDLREIVTLALECGHTELGNSVAHKYFDMHSGLSSNHLLSHGEASAFLSHSLLIARLAKDEFMSAAQIANLVSARDDRVGFSRQSVETVLGHLDLKPRVTRERHENLFEVDRSLEETLLADADLMVAADMVATAARQLGFPRDVAGMLMTLVRSQDLDEYTPYLQMLHYQCSIAEFYDHAVTDLYEFAPRGATWFFEQYPEVMVSAGNPFLNNAKSVERATIGWARSKKARHRPGALALVGLLEGLEEMGFAARQELAGWIRRWLHRVMRVASEISYRLPERLDPPQIERLLASVAAAQTNTAGILEQRLVDAISSMEHSVGDGWRARGLSDAVNATNVSRRKLGDCDYQHTTNRYVHAYEAHGGRLTDIYFQEHLRTLRRSLSARADEWSGFSDREEWEVMVTFIAHESDIPGMQQHNIDGTPVNLAVKSFRDFVAEAPPADELVEAFANLVLTPLNERRTPNSARRKLLELVGA